jgi:hypothetical protein
VFTPLYIEKSPFLGALINRSIMGAIQNNVMNAQMEELWLNLHNSFQISR